MDEWDDKDAKTEHMAYKRHLNAAYNCNDENIDYANNLNYKGGQDFCKVKNVNRTRYQMQPFK